MKIVNRTSRVPAYIFSRFEDIKKKLISDGVNIIDLGIGDPDTPTPGFIVDAMGEFIKNPYNHRYPPYSGTDEFKRAVAEYYMKNYNVELDYRNEIAALIGSKEGIAHLFLALTDPGDYVLLPDPAYPVYYAAAVIAGCSVYKMPLFEQNNYLPGLENIYYDVIKKSKMLLINYPNNPTGAVAVEEFYEKLIDFGIKNEVSIINDGAYLGIYSGNNRPKSILEIPGAKKTCAEFGSLSKTFNMSGWRLGYIAGSKEIIEKLMIIKTNFDSGQFGAIQQVGALALKSGEWFTKYINGLYEKRRKIVKEKLESKGLYVYDSKAAFYVWFRVPKEYSSEEFSEEVLQKTGVLITPGNAFGNFGEGYCRISLTVDTDKIEKAMDRIIKI